MNSRKLDLLPYSEHIITIYDPQVISNETQVQCDCGDVNLTATAVLQIYRHLLFIAETRYAWGLNNRSATLLRVVTKSSKCKWKETKETKERCLCESCCLSRETNFNHSLLMDDKHINQLSPSRIKSICHDPTHLSDRSCSGRSCSCPTLRCLCCDSERRAFREGQELSLMEGASRKVYSYCNPLHTACYRCNLSDPILA